MENLKLQIIDKFTKELHSLDLSLNDELLSIKYRSITEKLLNTLLVKKEKIEEHFNTTKSNEEKKCTFENTFGLSSGKSFDTLIGSNNLSPEIQSDTNKSKSTELTTIPNNLSLTYDMEQYAKLKYIRDVEIEFEKFKLFHKSKSTRNADWIAVWKLWVLKNHQNKNHLEQSSIDEKFSLDTGMRQLAQEYIEKDMIDIEFTKFKNHYLASGVLKVSWIKVWENWCINHKQFKPKAPKEQSVKQKEKADYRWDFRKAKDTSDRIKEWLEFEKGIKWLEDFYLKDIPIPGIGWKDVMHPDFNREEILLFKIDSQNGQYMLKNTSDDIIEAEVQEHD